MLFWVVIGVLVGLLLLVVALDSGDTGCPVDPPKPPEEKS